MLFSLPRKGWNVTGVAFSEAAVKQAKARATVARVSIDAIVEDLDFCGNNRVRRA